MLNFLEAYLGSMLAHLGPILALCWPILALSWLQQERCGCDPNKPYMCDHVVSSFCIPEMRHLASLENVKSVRFSQCMFGQNGKKPTRFLCVHLDSFVEILVAHRSNFLCTGDHEHNALIGLREDGSGFKTAPAKQYPPRLCYAMSFIIVSGIYARIGHEPEPNEWIDNEKVVNFFTALDPYIEGQGYGEFGMDYAAG